MTPFDSTALAAKLDSKVWTGGQHVRIYIDAIKAMDMAGYAVMTSKGRIIGCKSQSGSRMSNNQANQVRNAHSSVWLDIKTGKVCSKDRDADIAEIQKAVDAMIADLEAAPVETAPVKAEEKPVAKTPRPSHRSMSWREYTHRDGMSSRESIFWNGIDETHLSPDEY